MCTRIIKSVSCSILKNGKKLNNVHTLMARSLMQGSSSYSYTLDTLITSKWATFTTALTGKHIGLRLKSVQSHHAIPMVYYEDIKNLGPNVILIDVREPNELYETGRIPGSINIPLGDLAEELSLDGDASKFKNKYGIPKPGANAALIFHCKSGKRSQNAAESAKALGYNNVKNYKGSWDDWAEREGLPN